MPIQPLPPQQLSPKESAALISIWSLHSDMEKYRLAGYGFRRPHGCGLPPIPEEDIQRWVRAISYAASELRDLADRLLP